MDKSWAADRLIPKPPATGKNQNGQEKYGKNGSLSCYFLYEDTTEPPEQNAVAEIGKHLFSADTWLLPVFCIFLNGNVNVHFFHK